MSARPGGAKFAALRHPDCRFYLLGTMLSMMADNVEHVISYWVLYQKFHSPALAGMSNVAAQLIAQTLVQLLAPPEKRGRVVGVYNMSSGGLRAGSGVTVGVLGGFIGLHWSLASSALTLCIVALVLLLYTARASTRAASSAPPLRSAS